MLNIILNLFSVSIQNLFILFFSQKSTPVDTIEESGDFLMIAMGIWLISLFIVRWRITKFVLSTMNKASKKAINPEPEVLIDSEIKAKNKPVFEDLNKNSDYKLAIEKREQFVKNAFLLFRKKYFYGLLAILVYIMLPFGLYKLSGQEASDESLGIIVMLIAFYFILINFNYYFYRKQFRPQDANFGVRFEHPYVTLLRKIVNPTMEAYLTFLIVYVIFSFGLQEVGLIESATDTEVFIKNTLFGVGLLLSSIFHLYTFFKIRRIAQKVSNKELLILRVFGDKKQTSLTFGKITNFWKHFGSWFTVADPSFMKRQNSFFTFKTLFTLVFLFIGAVILGLIIDSYLSPVIKSIFPETSDGKASEFAFIPGMVAAWILYFQYLRFKISRSYAKDIEDIRKKLHKTLHRPRKLDLTYKNLPIFCYNNTWKLAVSEFIKNSSVILMDLRGFSAERKGCEYEIDFLLDTFTINNILFLVDANSDSAFVQKTILARWEYLRVQSPNINIKNPKARIFVSDNQDEIDVQTIIDLLIVSVDESK
jgi:hypothetical protein